jgi:hypothetical protein
MSVYLIATIEVKAGAMDRFKAALGEIIPIVGGAGWKLVNAYALRTGQLGTVIDIWEMPDFNHLNLGMAAIAQSPRIADIQAALQDSIIKETISFADKLVYPGTV